MDAFFPRSRAACAHSVTAFGVGRPPFGPARHHREVSAAPPHRPTPSPWQSPHCRLALQWGQRQGCGMVPRYPPTRPGPEEARETGAVGGGGHVLPTGWAGPGAEAAALVLSVDAAGVEDRAHLRQLLRLAQALLRPRRGRRHTIACWAIRPTPPGL